MGAIKLSPKDNSSHKHNVVRIAEWICFWVNIEILITFTDQEAIRGITTFSLRKENCSEESGEEDDKT